MKKTIIAITIIILFSCGCVQAQGFKINGTVTGLQDGTWLYLRIGKPEKKIDSAKLINGSFTMSGRIAGKTDELILYTNSYTNYVIFWVENNQIDMILKAGEFKKGLIKGSATEDENKRMFAAKEQLIKQQDSLAELFKADTNTDTRKRLQVQLKNTEEQSRQFDRDYVRSHRSSVISANLLSIYASTWGRDTTSALYMHMSPEMKETRQGQDVSDYLALNKNVKVGDHFADFEQQDSAGKKVKLSSLKGKYILIDFWASWCGPCRAENPKLVKTYHAYQNKGFVILGVSLDDNKVNWLSALKQDKLEWENVSDLRGDKNRASLIYGIYSIPDNFLIDDKGIIIARNLRGEKLEEKLKELMP
jgi:thiol-disulfide isomerase/thioredoxin